MNQEFAETSRRRRALQSLTQLSVVSWFLLDLIIAFAAASAAFVLSPHDSAVRYAGGFLSLEFTLYAFLFGSVTAILANILGLHALSLNVRYSSLLNRCLAAALGAVILVSILLLFAQYETLGRYVMVISFTLIAVGLMSTRYLKIRFLSGNRALITFMGSAAFENKAVESVEKDIWLSYLFEPRRVRGLPQQLTSDVIDSGISEVVINTHDLELLSPAELTAYTENGVRVTSFTQFIEHNKQYVPVEEIDGKWIINAQLDRAHPYYNSFKRLIDILVSIIGLVVMSPILLVLVVMIRLDSQGDALYSQERIGQFGRKFKIYKLRSMTTDAEQDGARWAQVNDERITRIGNFLRKSRLDELPQLWNVLAGEMSLVGPRPEQPKFVTLLEAELPFYGQRHLVKPGITGWAQINYSYGASIEDAQIKLGYELYYIKNLSVALDFHIMLRTLGTLAAGSR